MLAILTRTTNQGSSFPLKSVVTDPETGETINKANILTFTFSLKDHITEAIINSREDVDVRPFVDEDGNFNMTIFGNDNIIISTNDSLDYETHVAVFKLVVNSDIGTLTHNHEIGFRVKRLRYL
jgi:hypothetical protein